MKKIILSLCVFSVASSFVSCGVKVEAEPIQKERYVKSSTGQAIALKYQSNECQTVLSEQEFAVSYPATAGESLIYRHKTNYESDRYYSEILLGGKFERTNYILIEKDATYYGSQEEVLTDPRALTLCSDVEYDFDSYESAAIHTAYILDMTYNKLKKNNLNGKLANLSPISLKIAPLIEVTTKYEKSKEIVTSKSVLVNNAYYNGATKEIVFLPQGKTEDGYIPFNGVPLWHIPITASHEYGHHVFNHLMPNYFDELSFHGHPLCFDNREKKISHMLNSSDNDNVHSMIRSINEGFSDLIGSYVLPENHRSLDIVPCLNDSREIAVDVFANGEEKFLSQSVLDKFVDSETSGQESCLASVDYKDPHIIGAVMAHAFDSIFNALEIDTDSRIKFLINWVASLNANYSEIKDYSASTFFKKAIGLFLKELGDYDRDENKLKKVCGVIENKAPLLWYYSKCAPFTL